MRKIQVVTLSIIAITGVFFASCTGSVSTDTQLKTEIDTISYAAGANLYNQGLAMHLQQLGLMTDTAAISIQYEKMIAADSIGAKADSLRKEMRFKIDSVSTANTRNIAQFLKGMKESINAPESQAAYFAGLSLGGQLSKMMFPNVIAQLYGPDAKEKVNPDAFLAAIATAMKGEKFLLENPDMIFNLKMQEAQEKARKKQEEELKAQYAPQIEAGNKFMEENKTKEGIVVLPSGVQYKIEKEGTGAKPTAADIVKVNYHGTLIDGTVFDSSVERGTPTTFNVSNVIRGWTEILQLMPVGSKWTVYIPYDLAYGAQDRGAIKPFSNLIFEVELLEIEKK